MNTSTTHSSRAMMKDGADVANGIVGADGANGIAGEDGIDGVNGNAGVDGVNGNIRVDGSAGADGAAGAIDGVATKLTPTRRPPTRESCRCKNADARLTSTQGRRRRR